jgi:hypothetical protein
VSQSIPAPAAGQLHYLKRSLAQQPGLPFADLLPANTPELLGDSSDPIYTPTVTLALFLGQTLEPDGTCQSAVTRLQAHRAATDEPAIGEGTGAYCKARKRLPEEALGTLARSTGAALSQRAPRSWLWNGRRLRVVDGSTFTAADTPANQKEYPQPDSQAPGLGFPMLRVVILFCIATGAVLQSVLSPYSGKQTGEISLFRRAWDTLDEGDVVLGDRIYCSYFEIARLKARGIDVVLHKHQSRKTDFRTGKRLGRWDHLIAWTRPQRPEWMEESTYEAIAERLELREVRIRVERPGFRVQKLELITTLMDASQVSVSELGRLYRMRWFAELNLRALKDGLGMKELVCKSPAMVRKEVWVYLLAYNLVRGSMCQAASMHNVKVDRVSFQSTVKSVLSFGETLTQKEGSELERCWQRLWRAIASHKIPYRPDRVEPRAVKRREHKYPYLNQPRKHVKNLLVKAKREARK